MYVVFSGGVIGIGGEAGWCAALSAVVYLSLWILKKHRTKASI